MIFIINKLKYDTSKMECISDKCEYIREINNIFGTGTIRVRSENVKLYRSKKRNWLLTYDKSYCVCGVSIQPGEAMDLLLKYDYEAYEKLFGELEEA